MKIAAPLKIRLKAEARVTRKLHIRAIAKGAQYRSVHRLYQPAPDHEASCIVDALALKISLHSYLEYL